MQTLNRFLSPKNRPAWLNYSIDLLFLAGIGWFAWQHAGFLLRDDLYLYGDHPGQFYRLWQLLAVIWPEEGRFIGWSPYWYAGYPEFQFYPPGFGMAGWLLWLLSFKQLSPVAVYQSLVFISYLLPGVGFYLLLARGLQDRLAGLAAAWLPLAATFALGGSQGVVIGLLGERLAFGLMPLLVLAGLWLFQAERKLRPWLVTGLILTGIMLLHPYQAIVPTAALGLYAFLGGSGWQSRLRWLVLAVLLGFALTAFWWFPFLFRRAFFIPLIEAPLPEIRSNLDDMWLAGMGWFLAAALLGAVSRQKKRRWLPLAIFLSGGGMLAFIFFDYLVLVSRLNLYILDPVRLVAGVTFALFVGLALGLSELSWLGVRLLGRWSKGMWGLPLVVILPWLVYSQVAGTYDPAAWLGRWQPRPGRTPIFLSEAEARYGLEEVWTRMATTPGRLLFTAHYGLLFDIPTSLKAVTPVLTGREIVGGTFTHRTPVGSYLWVGRAYPPVLRGKVEHQDDQSLAGQSWASMDEDFLFELVRRLNATLIVTTAIDTNAQAFLESSSRFRRVWSNNLFTFYEPVGYRPGWVAAEGATATASRYERRQIDVAVTEAEPGATLLVKVANYPLWRAEIEGEPVPIETGPYGLMRLSLPPGSYTLQLRYQPGWPERLGNLLSLIAAVAAVGVVAYAARR